LTNILILIILKINI